MAKISLVRLELIPEAIPDFDPACRLLKLVQDDLVFGFLTTSLYTEKQTTAEIN